MNSQNLEKDYDNFQESKNSVRTNYASEIGIFKASK